MIAMIATTTARPENWMSRYVRRVIQNRPYTFNFGAGMLALAGGHRGQLLDRLHDRRQERGQVVGLAAGDQVAVAHHLGVEVLGAGVDDVVLDGEKARRLLALERLRRAEDPRAVADGAD